MNASDTKVVEPEVMLEGSEVVKHGAKQGNKGIRGLLGSRTLALLLVVHYCFTVVQFSKKTLTKN